MTALNSELFLVVQQRVRHYRLIAVAILALGFLGAGAIYWLPARAPDYSDDPAMAGFNRSEDRQMGMLYGKQGQLVEDLENSLKQPGTQAILILIAATVVATVCFQLARILEDNARVEAGQADNATNGPPPN